ncbi:MAG: translation initiation factor IF-6 [Thermoplasmata archaeon]
MPVGRTTISGSPYLGVYLRASESHAVVPRLTPEGLKRDIERILGVTVLPSSVAECELLGALVAFNSHGVAVGERLDPVERAELSSIGPVREIRVRQNALGNNVLVNDHGALVHPEFSDGAVAELHAALGVPVQRGTIAGLGTVGMAGSATNRGVVVHPKATDRELPLVAEALGVPVHRSTANFGVAVVGACLIANSRGILTGSLTTPVEVSHLQEGFGIFD